MMITLVVAAQLGLHLACMAGAARLLARRTASPQLRVTLYRVAIAAAFVTFLAGQVLDVARWTLRLPSTTVLMPVGPTVTHGRDGRSRVVITREMTTTSTIPLCAWAVVGVWGIGVVWRGARLVAGGWQHRRRWRGASRLWDRSLQRCVAEFARQGRVTRPVELWSVPGITMPMVDWAGRIGLPPHVVHVLDGASLRAVVAHEMAHVARNDAAWRVIAAALTTVGWWVPGLHTLFTRMQTEAEFVADAWASALTKDPLALATALAEAANWDHGSSVAAAAATGDGRAHVLVTRIERLLATPEVRRPVRVWAFGGIVAAALTLMLVTPRVLPAATSVMELQTGDGTPVRFVVPNVR